METSIVNCLLACGRISVQFVYGNCTENERKLYGNIYENSFFEFLVGTLKGFDLSKKMRVVRTIHFHQCSCRELHHTSCFSVIENDIKKQFSASEYEGSDLGILWPNGPPSSDWPVVWHADNASEAPGSRPVLLPH